MVVNDNAGCQVPPRRSRVFREQARSYKRHRPLARKTQNAVGASSLAMIVNDNAGCQVPRGALGFFASKLAPTRGIGRWREKHKTL
ncbi:hypothetical protein PSJE_01955 [Pseudomonas jessenii]|nr:hypothetical protein PSJE_01955 [Pseudomonas jessenii]